MAKNIVNAVINTQKVVMTRPLYQYDYGMQIKFVGIELDGAFQAHFSNSNVGESVTQIGTDNVVTIPNEFLETGETVYCWLYVHTGETDGETIYKIIIPVFKRARPTDIEPTPEQEDLINQLIIVLNAGATSATTSAERAEQAAENAEQYAANAEEYMQDTQQYHDDSLAYSMSAKTSEENAALSEYKAGVSENNAKNSAEIAEISADRAEQAAANAGYMAIGMNEFGHLIYERTDTVDVDFSLNEFGHLIMRGV